MTTPQKRAQGHRLQDWWDRRALKEHNARLDKFEATQTVHTACLFMVLCFMIGAIITVMGA